jgi:Dolichyl-phosphate-mannose-protein mannosyltransferase
MTTYLASSSTIGARASGVRARLRQFALPGALALGAANFLWQLGGSSYFVDEVQSLEVATRPWHGVLHATSAIELAPPAYFYFLHTWLTTLGSTSESVARLPSAICGVLLVGAVYWLSTLVSERRAVGIGAAALAAISPFVLEYAQRAQPYVFEMLAVTVAFCAALQAERAPRRRGWWLSAAAAASMLSLCLIYTAGFAIAVLCVWLASRKTLPARWRVAFVGVCIAAAAALVPLALAQHRAFPHRSGVEAIAGVSWTTVGRVIGAPFDGRVAAPPLLGVLAIFASLAVLVGSGRRALRARGLLLSVAVGGPLTVIVLSALGGSAFWGHLMLSRYVAFAVPMDLVLIAAAMSELWRSRRVVGAALGACVAVVAISGLVASHRAGGFYLDARGVAAYIRSHERRTDALIAPGDAVAQLPLLYYGLRPDWSGSWQAADDLRRRADPLWVIYKEPASAPTVEDLMNSVRPLVRDFGYQPLDGRLFPGVIPLAVVRMSPLKTRAGPHRPAVDHPGLVRGRQTDV